jgi:hypothetical protein
LVLVGPTLKNRIAIGHGGDLRTFTARYASTYGANKAHALHNYDRLLELFENGTAATPKTMRGHIADSALQSLAYALFCGDYRKARGRY